MATKVALGGMPVSFRMLGVNYKDVSQRYKGGHTSQEFSAYICLVFFNLKNLPYSDAEFSAELIFVLKQITPPLLPLSDNSY